MRNASILVQTFLLLIGLTLLIFLVRPMLTTLGENQDKLSEYDNAIAEASQVNALLQNLVTSIESIPPEQAQALAVYMPEVIDPLTVQRDLRSYVERRPLLLLSLDRDGVQQQQRRSNQAASDEREKQEFSLSVQGEYADIKDLLFDMERNTYPLHLTSLQIRPLNTQQLQANIVVNTYGLVLNNEADSN